MYYYNGKEINTKFTLVSEVKNNGRIDRQNLSSISGLVGYLYNIKDYTISEDYEWYILDNKLNKKR